MAAMDASPSPTARETGSNHPSLDKTFLESVGLHHPKTQAEINLLYKELGPFLAASTFSARTTEILDLPEQAIQDSKEQMRLRAVCDERITLLLRAFRHVPGIFDKLSARLGAQNMVDVQVAWRCNCELWWVTLAPLNEAQQIYQSLGYSQAEVEKFLQHAVEFGADRVQAVPLPVASIPGPDSTM